jgi:hypothetical protein
VAIGAKTRATHPRGERAGRTERTQGRSAASASVRAAVALSLAAGAAQACGGGGVRTLVLDGTTVTIDESRGRAGTTMRVGRCAVRGLRYDADFEQWAVDGETDGALYETLDAVAARLVETGYARRCASARGEDGPRPVLRSGVDADEPPSE